MISRTRCLTGMIYDSGQAEANGIRGVVACAAWNWIYERHGHRSDRAGPTAYSPQVLIRSNKNTLNGPKMKIGPHAISMAHVDGPEAMPASVGGMLPAIW